MSKCPKCGMDYSDIQTSAIIMSKLKDMEYNSMYGAHIHKMLDEYRRYWSKIDVPDDVNIFEDGFDTLYLYPKDAKTQDITLLLGYTLGGDEVDWTTVDGVDCVRVWWD